MITGSCNKPSIDPHTHTLIIAADLIDSWGSSFEIALVENGFVLFLRRDVTVGSNSCSCAVLTINQF